MMLYTTIVYFLMSLLFYNSMDAEWRKYSYIFLPLMGYIPTMILLTKGLIEYKNGKNII